MRQFSVTAGKINFHANQEFEGFRHVNILVFWVEYDLPKTINVIHEGNVVDV